MKKILNIISILFSLFLTAQKCSDITQNITAYGHFNFTTTNKDYQYYKKQSIQSLEIVETNSENNLKIFQQKFPDVYDGKCLKIKSKNTSDNEFILCDKNQEGNIDLEFKTLGHFKLISIIENLFVFKYLGFEIEGYLVFNSSDKYFYTLNGKPKISPDKKIIYSVYNNPHDGLNINMIQLNYYRELSYRLQGKININSVALLKYEHTGNYGLLLDLDREIDIRNENHDLIGKENCSTILRID
ncbi:hypothetical protein ACI513_17815 [Chryseobacterium sp. M5]|uniref:hypothetical protein n=1 Tax=Chryseobacterium sp. M5 TaxID=3379128 RepID=UPI0038579E96